MALLLSVAAVFAFAACGADPVATVNGEKISQDAYREYVNQLTQRVDYLASSISGALNQLPDSVTVTSNRFLDQVDRMTEALNQAQVILDDAIDRMNRR